MPVIDDIIALLDFFLNLIIHGWKYILVCGLLP